MESPADIVKRLLLKFKSKDLKFSKPGTYEKITCQIPKNVFPGFISSLKSVGSPSSKPFSVTGNEFIPVEISLLSK